jgi:hypothetical protein
MDVDFDELRAAAEAEVEGSCILNPQGFACDFQRMFPSSL